MRMFTVKLVDFARCHRCRNLGYRFLTRVRDVRHEDNLPLVARLMLCRDEVHAINGGHLGLALSFINLSFKFMNYVSFIFMNNGGDFLRVLEKAENPMNLDACEVIAFHPKVIGTGKRFAAAGQRMRAANVKVLVVVYGQETVASVPQKHDMSDLPGINP
jgi:hypothetical protein